MDSTSELISVDDPISKTMRSNQRVNLLDRRRQNISEISARPSYSNYSEENDDDDTIVMIPTRYSTSASISTWVRRAAASCCRCGVQIVGDDWMLLTLLGITVAVIGFSLDYAIASLHGVRETISTCMVCSCAIHNGYSYLLDCIVRNLLSFLDPNLCFMTFFPEAIAIRNPFLMYLAWVFFTCSTLFLSTFITTQLSSHAIGSGIPQMKSILQGTVLPHYLSIRTLVSKIIGLTLAAGSGIPIGKEGPFVHIASIIAEQFMQHIFQGFLDSESRRLSLLAAGCAVGVASNFGAPIGGVLFSIEVTSTYFAVRNYWRAFYASVIAAFVFRLSAVVVENERTITSLFTTEFDVYPFDLAEMFAFSILGVLCGIFGSFFVFLHRKLIEAHAKYTRRGHALAIISKYRFLYAIIISFIVATFTFPGLIGKHLSLVQNEEINHLFTTKKLQCLEEWEGGSLLLSLAVFIVVKFLLTILAITIPVPAGVFVPVFVLGAAFGRLTGEVMALWFPNGLAHDVARRDFSDPCEWDPGNHIVPGGYAVVGAAALAGSVTHTISTSVIVFELTGQMHHILPVMVAVLISNAVCQALSPSIYDSIIQIRGLPFLPDIRRAAVFQRTVDKIMLKNPPFVSRSCTYGRIRHVLRKSNLTYLPLVDDSSSKVLLGSIHRNVLANMIHEALVKPATDDELRAVNAPLGADYIQSNYVLKEISKLRLRQHVDLSQAEIDSSPFQLVRQTSLHKVHVLFSTLGVNIAFVTDLGRLIGVVDMEQIRHAIQAAGVRRLERGRQDIRQTMSTLREMNSRVTNAHSSSRGNAWFGSLMVGRTPSSSSWNRSCAGQSVADDNLETSDDDSNVGDGNENNDSAESDFSDDRSDISFQSTDPKESPQDTPYLSGGNKSNQDNPETK